MADKKRRKATTDELLRRVRGVASYRGKHVILIHGQVYGVTKGPGLGRIVDRARRDYPGETPTLVYVPDADTLVLVVSCRP